MCRASPETRVGWRAVSRFGNQGPQVKAACLVIGPAISVENEALGLWSALTEEATFWRLQLHAGYISPPPISGYVQAWRRG